MPFWHRSQARPVLALAMVIGLLPSLRMAPPPVDPASAEEAPGGCCPAMPAPACPACPTEGRSSCPVAPSRAATCRTCEVLPPREEALEPREARAERASRDTGETPAAAPALTVSRERRAEVRGTSPPVRLLACTFRN